MNMLSKKQQHVFFCIAPVSLGAYFFRVGVQYSTNVENFKLTRKSGHSTTATQMMTSVFFFFCCCLSFLCIHVFFKEAKYRKVAMFIFPTVCVCMKWHTQEQQLKSFKLNLRPVEQRGFLSSPLCSHQGGELQHCSVGTSRLKVTVHSGRRGGL